MNHVFVVSGYTQKRWSCAKDAGSVALYRMLRSIAAPRTAVYLREWDDDPRGWARLVVRDKTPEGRVIVCAYSYGGGWWFDHFARELFDAGVPVDVAVLCDPVYREKHWWLRWRAFFAQSQRIPENVRRVAHFTQHRTEPGGDRLIADPAATDYHGPYVLPYTHTRMDNAVEYHSRATREVGRLL